MTGRRWFGEMPEGTLAHGGKTIAERERSPDQGRPCFSRANPLVLSSPHMRAAAILGLGCSPKDLEPFQHDVRVEWRVGMPTLGEADAILLFGGDGTIHRHLGQLVRLGLPVLIVPAGSGNDFASSLGLRRAQDSLTAWRKFCETSAGARSIDLGFIKPLPRPEEAPSMQDAHYFCCVAGVGFDGEVARRANQLPRWLRGHGGYLLSVVPTIFTFAPFPLRILTSDEDANSWNLRSDQPTLLAVFANTPFYGGGMKVAPEARMDDGLLDVCIVGKVSPLRLFRLFPTVYSGQHLKIREVEYFQSSRIRVETEHPTDIYADGEYVCRTPIEISVQRAALKVIAPA